MAEHHDLLRALVGALNKGGVRVVDLTRPLSPATPVIQLPPQFAGSPPFSIQELSRYDERGPAWYWNSIACGEHTGTHFDAPIHWITGKDHPGNATDTIPVGQFVAPACVIDAVEYAARDPDFLLTPDHIRQWEDRHGRIPAGAWVLFRTHWSERTDAAAYLNIAEDGAHTPGPRADLPRFLAEERDVLGFGTETVGTDAGQAFGFDPAFPCHSGMHGANKFGLASLVNLDQLPPTGAVVIAAPLKIVNGSGSPLRVLALVPVD